MMDEDTKAMLSDLNDNLSKIGKAFDRLVDSMIKNRELPKKLIEKVLKELSK